MVETNDPPLEYEPISNTVRMPKNAAARIRDLLSINHEDELRISYICGPGDARGTYDYWLKGEFDPRAPTIAYSTMFFQVCAALAAKGQIISSAVKTQPSPASDQFLFETIRSAYAKNVLIYYWRSLRSVLDAQIKVRRFKPHLLVVSSDFPALGLLLMRSHTPLIVLSLHNLFWSSGQADYSPKEKLKIAALKVSASALRSAVCTSNECAKQLSTLSSGRVKTFVQIPQQKPTAPATIREHASTRTLLYLGRIEADKGVFDLLSAFTELTEKYPDLQLIFAGAGSAETALRSEIGRLNSTQVKFIGKISAEEIDRQIRDAYLLICPTRRSFKEGLAVVCIEAAIRGVPSIASSVVPAANLMPDAIDIFEANSTASLIRAAEKVLNDPQYWRQKSDAALRYRDMFFDRHNSWGSKLYEAIEAAAKIGAVKKTATQRVAV